MTSSLFVESPGIITLGDNVLYALPLDEALALSVAWEHANPPERYSPGRCDYEAEDATLAEV